MQQRTGIVTEDEAATGAAVAARRRSMASSVELAADGPTDVAVGDDVSLDLLILDLVLPGLDGREERSRVRSALAQLPRKQAAALVLRYVGLSYADVAAALHLSASSVGTTLRCVEPALPKELFRHASCD